MATNPILEESYAIRRRIMIEHGDDLAGYLHAEFERLRASGHPVANIEQRRIRRTGVPKSGEPAVENTPSSHRER